MDLPSGWISCPLIDACDVIAGQSPESQYYNQDGLGIPFFQGKADFGTIFPTNRVYCTKPTKTAESGDILLSVRAPVGPTNLTRESVAIGRGINAIRPLGGISSWFILYYFRSIEPVLSGVGTGTTFKAVTVDEVRNVELHLPPLAEQHRIVEKIDALFSKLDKGVEYLQTIKQQLKTYRQAVLKWAFEGGWEFNWVKMKDVSSAFGGGAFKSRDFGTSGSYQVLRIGNVRNGIIRYMEKPVYIQSLDVWSKRYLLMVGDVIITLTGTRKKRDYGFTAIVDKENMLLNQRIAAIHFNPLYVPKFFLYYSWTQNFKNDFFSDETGNVGQGNVGMKAITETLIPSCSLEEQDEIVNEIESRLSVCDNLEQLINENLAKTEALRQSILKKAFEGRLVPQDPNDEPADKLLERIKAKRTTQTSPARRRQKNVR